MGLHLAANWPDLLEKDIRKVYMDQYPILPAMVPDLFRIEGSEAAFEKSTQVGPVPDHAEFTGRIAVVERTQGLERIVIALVKFCYMLGSLVKAFITDKVKKWKIETISRKDFFGGSLDFSMVKVG